jgi:1-aminocyclopropane-1-carboxylate deaminase/D-cysteine desulfhydrase-like pyridoxal-dependent ACC family enzyme
MTPAFPAALAALRRHPVGALGPGPTAIEPLDRFRQLVGLSPRVLIKRDDTIPFGFGGNKVRKLRYVIPVLQREGVDHVITCGGVQSNHARATAAAAAASGMQCHIVVNGVEPERPSGNALINRLLGATFEYVAARSDRVPTMEAAALRLRRDGRRPTIVPLGASTPLGALGFVDAIGEMLSQGCVPDVIVHASSSGGTSAGLLAGVAVHGLHTRVIGISADDPPAAIHAEVASIVRGLGPLLDVDGEALYAATRPEFDDAFVGPGYGAPTDASREAQQALARSQAILVDHTYSAKALAGLMRYCRDGRIARDATVLFWHTGGQVALFA